MAVMYPTDLENYNCTDTEREMYEAFRDQLPQRYQVFYSIRWFETNEENKRVDSECDFLVFDPSFGFLTIEVKGGIGIEIEVAEDIEKKHGMKVVEIPKCSWVVFRCEGQDEKDINELWTRIYKEFFITSSYKQCMDIDFELYDDKDTEIWIPISKE